MQRLRLKTPHGAGAFAFAISPVGSENGDNSVMGLTCSLHRATESDVGSLLADPAALAGFLDADDGSAPRVRQVRPKGFLGWLLRLTPITISEVEPEAAEDAPYRPPDPDRSIDIEKAWHGLHFLLTGTADEGEEPACFLLRGGEDLDDEGLTRALRPGQVRRFSQYLAALEADDLAARYDPERMTRLEIYPDTIWKRTAAPGESPLEWLMDSFEEVRQFLDKAAASGDCVIITIG
jgi:hypothetical protein